MTHRKSKRKIPTKNLQVFLGQHNLVKQGEQYVTAYEVRDIKSHEDYNPFTIDSDIALLNLDREVDYNQHIYPICLPDPEDIFEDQIATVAGWGDIDPIPGLRRQKFPDTLKKVNVTIFNKDKCDRSAKTDTKICAGNEEGDKDSCNGDSGGPLMCRFSDGEKFKLCGSVSYGSVRCGLKGVPGVYVNIAKFVKWVMKNTDKMCSDGNECVPASQCPEIKKQIDVINVANFDPLC